MACKGAKNFLADHVFRVVASERAGKTVWQTSKKWWLLGCLVVSILVADQTTKLYVHRTFALYEARPVVGNFFTLTYVRNSGAAFGMLARQNRDFLRIFFPVITGLAIMALVIYFIYVPPYYTFTLWGIGLILGGAIGNGIDRLWLGQVIDFIDVHWYNYHWPAFNIADSAICIGVGFLLVDSFLYSHHPPTPE
jgi:signal peptidase II